MNDRPVRVLHVIRPEESGSLGGADLHVLDLCAAQAQGPHCRPAVLALDASQDFLRRAGQLGVAVHDPFRHRAGRWRRLAELPRALGIDIVHAHGYEADYVATFSPMAASAWRGLPRVLTCHGIIAPDLCHKVMNTVDLWCMHRASVLIAVAAPAAEMLRRAVWGVPVHLIPNGVGPPSAVEPAERAKVRAELGTRSPQDILIGFVGRLSAEKRPDLLLQAAGQIAREQPAARFSYVGGGPLTERMRRAVRHARLEDRVTLAGLRHDMNAVYAAIDVLVLPSDIEGTARVLIEAQMRGVPVVATAVGGSPELVCDGVTGLLVPPGRADVLTSTVTRLIADHDLRARMGRSAADTAQKRTAKVMAEAVQEIYRALLPQTAKEARPDAGFRSLQHARNREKSR